DHNPGFGADHKGYNMLDINLNDAEEGFLNHFSVPYFIWGNNAVKKTFNKEFKETGNTISPNYLMPELFEYLGIKGNEYTQFINRTKKYLPVIHPAYYNEGSKFVRQISSVNKLKLNNYEKINYYYINNFISR
ncbi:MAG: hypothetical protein PHO63_04215, partial [Bacilli bacterium]|nr:hypothetical protein [Bacilli bacterium]